MSDINDNLDESIPFIKIRNTENDQSSFLGNTRSDKNEKNLGVFFSFNHNDISSYHYIQILRTYRALRPTSVKPGDVLLVRDGKYTSLEMKSVSQHKLIESIDLSSGSNSLELLFSKLANFIEITTPQSWNNISFYFHDIVEDHRENLIPNCRSKYGIQWFANCITIWRLLLFFGYFVFSLVKQIITFRHSSL